MPCAVIVKLLTSQKGRKSYAVAVKLTCQKIQDTDLCITKSAVKLMNQHKKTRVVSRDDPGGFLGFRTG